MNIPETMAATIATTTITITLVFCSVLASPVSVWTIKANTIKTQPKKEEAMATDIQKSNKKEDN